jgi:outer membrane receptor protein involved in Fe transport
VNFLVPNTIEQQEAGQRQDRQGAETAGQVQYQHIFSPRSLAVSRGMVRDTSAKLWSNPLSTPILAAQDRGFREGSASGSYRYDGEHHAIKFGGDYRTAGIRESFQFAEAGDPEESFFHFSGRGRSHEASVFLQDHFSVGRLVIDAGVRFDSYRLLVHDTAVSPRVGAAYYWEAADLLFRGSYDRVFSRPPSRTCC